MRILLGSIFIVKYEIFIQWAWWCYMSVKKCKLGCHGKVVKIDNGNSHVLQPLPQTLSSMDCNCGHTQILCSPVHFQLTNPKNVNVLKGYYHYPYCFSIYLYEYSHVFVQTTFTFIADMNQRLKTGKKLILSRRPTLIILFVFVHAWLWWMRIIHDSKKLCGFHHNFSKFRNLQSNCS